jgi:hypothetical protein
MLALNDDLGYRSLSYEREFTRTLDGYRVELIERG